MQAPVGSRAPGTGPPGSCFALFRWLPSVGSALGKVTVPALCPPCPCPCQGPPEAECAPRLPDEPEAKRLPSDQPAVHLSSGATAGPWAALPSTPASGASLKTAQEHRAPIPHSYDESALKLEEEEFNQLLIRPNPHCQRSRSQLSLPLAHTAQGPRAGRSHGHSSSAVTLTPLQALLRSRDPSTLRMGLEHRAAGAFLREPWGAPGPEPRLR